MMWTRIKPGRLCANPIVPSIFAIGKRIIWKGIKHPKSSAEKKTSLPQNFHFEKTYPLAAPMNVEISTEGTAILIEFQKYLFIPSQVTPIQAVSHADFQASNENSLGKDIRLPVLISFMVFKEVNIIIIRGIKKYMAAMTRIAYNPALKKIMAGVFW